METVIHLIGIEILK